VVLSLQAVSSGAAFIRCNFQFVSWEALLYRWHENPIFWPRPARRLEVSALMMCRSEREERADAAERHMTTRKLIVVVDDDTSMLGAIERALKAYGFDCSTFDKVEDFLDHANLDEAACLVLDINLNGGASGIELRHQLMRSGHSQPVIFITGADSDVQRERVLKSGCVAYLTKPFASQMLVEAIQKSVTLVS
jgi:CheY-like chemotaxis protein